MMSLCRRSPAPGGPRCQHAQAMRARAPLPCRALARRHSSTSPTTTTSGRAAVVARAAAQQQDAAVGGYLAGEDFYTILGVAPTATSQEVKRAYYGLVRECHPDRSATEEAHELTSLLNEIYDTLSDSDRRATYDAISGFSGNSVNPFLDDAFARDQVFVDELSCIGCGKCVRACPATFFIEASKYGRARVVAQGVDTVDEIQIAIESCPVDCIHWVSLPQLQLLEAALGSMARVEVYIMMRYGRSGGNVFEAAFKAWQRRQAAINARVAAHRKPNIDWGAWASEGSQYDEAAAQAAAANMDPARRKIANLAAAAARAARLWRSSNQGARVVKGAITESSMSSMDA